MSKLQAIRGMKDILPNETPLWQWLENRIRNVTRQYGYQEIRPNLLEPVSLFERAVGQETDIVSKEMYNFLDKGGDHITLRPEGTSGCVRAIIENNLCYNTTQRVWYQGPMFRYERPQKGRLRQFNQFGVETFGMAGADIDAELIFMTHDMLKAIGVRHAVRLEINSLGTPEERKEHRAQLVAYLNQHKALLDEDSLRRLDTNPLRILDSKNPAMQVMIDGAPKLLEFLQEESRTHFEQVCKLLDAAGIDYIINPRLVRGLDYYTRTVFEWITEELGSQGTVCGGGRYDGLVELFSKKPLPASGFAMGIERLLLLIETLNAAHDVANAPDVYVTFDGKDNSTKALLLANTLRQHLPQCIIFSDFSGAKLQRQHSNALKSGCRFVITLNENGEIGCWDLDSKQNDVLSINDIAARIASVFPA